MAQSSELKEFEARRRQLLDESAQLRHQFATECVQLQAATSWIDTGYSAIQSVRGYWPLIAAGAGFFLTRKRGGMLRSLGRIWSLWKIARKALELWRGFSREESEVKAETPVK